MKKPKKDPVREERIENQIIVDAYGPEEQALGWYYYLEDQLPFPFQARCLAARVVSPLKKGEIVEVRRMAPEESCTSDMLVVIGWQGVADYAKAEYPSHSPPREICQRLSAVKCSRVAVQAQR